MKFSEFEHVVSSERMNRYLIACGGNTKKSMTLYRLNLRLSQEIFTIVSCFEIALRNAIDYKLVDRFGSDWLRDSIQNGGIFSSNSVGKTKVIIDKSYNELIRNGCYTHSRLLASMEFGVWKYMFSRVQYNATGRCLLGIFPNKPRSTAMIQYNHTYIFNELDKVNSIRNRIAHHEPIIYVHGNNVADVSYVNNEYQKIQILFSWMGINSKSLLYGLDHVDEMCDEIMRL